MLAYTANAIRKNTETCTLLGSPAGLVGAQMAVKAPLAHDGGASTGNIFHSATKYTSAVPSEGGNAIRNIQAYQRRLYTNKTRTEHK